MNTIGVLARADLQEAGPVIRELVDWLRERGQRPCLDEATAALGGPGLESSCLVASGRDMAGLASALVVLGGDGTLLAASRLLEKPIPVLGVNFGSLGFLTEITLHELYPTLEGVLDGRFDHEDRRLLRAVVHRQGRQRRDRGRAQRRGDHEGGPVAHHRGGRDGRRARSCRRSGPTG